MTSMDELLQEQWTKDLLRRSDARERAQDESARVNEKHEILHSVILCKMNDEKELKQLLAEEKAKNQLLTEQLERLTRPKVCEACGTSEDVARCQYNEGDNRREYMYCEACWIERLENKS